MGNPGEGFELVGTRTLLRTRFLVTERIHLQGPDGLPIDRVVVRHPGAVGVVPLDDDDVILIEQYRPAIGTSLLEIPAGKVDAVDEPRIETARRELVEEVGYRARQIEHLCDYYASPGFTDELLSIFLATGLEPVPAAPMGIEEQTARIERMPFGRALDLVSEGRISDGKTIIALFAAARMM